MLVTLVGTMPLLMHNVQLADPENPFAVAIKKLTDKRSNKTDDDMAEIARLKFAGGLYHHPEIGPYLPAENIFRTIQGGASLTRKGKEIERGVIFLSTMAPLEYDGPRDIDGLWGGGKSPFVDRRMVNGTPGAAKVTKVPGIRPIFPEWRAEIEVELDLSVINPDDFADYVAKAGRMIGIGDYRRFYGRFEGKVSE